MRMMAIGVVWKWFIVYLWIPRKTCCWAPFCRLRHLAIGVSLIKTEACIDIYWTYVFKCYQSHQDRRGRGWSWCERKWTSPALEGRRGRYCPEWWHFFLASSVLSRDYLFAGVAVITGFCREILVSVWCLFISGFSWLVISSLLG